MKIIMIECNAEELTSNRTIMDSVTNALDNFANRMVGVTNIDWSKINMSEDEEGEKNDN